jgi:hypothetical protein
MKPPLNPCVPSSVPSSLCPSVRSSMRIDTLEAPRLPAAHHPSVHPSRHGLDERSRLWGQLALSIRPVMVLMSAAGYEGNWHCPSVPSWSWMSAAGYEGNWQSSHLRHSVCKYMCAFTISVPFSRSRTLSLSPHCVGSENVHCNRSGAIFDVTFFGRNLKWDFQ